MTEQSLSDKRAAAANARWARENPGHPLFLYDANEKAEPIGWINLRRYGVNGPVDCQRVWPSNELVSEDQIFSMYGGGVYELIGRLALPDGTPGRGVKKRRLTLEGPSRPFSGEEQAHVGTSAPAAAAPAGMGTFEMMMAMMAEDRREARARDERASADRRAEEERREAREAAARQATAQLLVQGFGVVSTIVTAVLSRPAAPSMGAELMPLLAKLVPEPDRSDPLEKLGKILDVAKKMQPEAKEEGVSDFMAGLGQVLQPVAALEDLRQRAAREGIPSPLPQPGGPPSSAPPPMQTPPPGHVPEQLNGDAGPYDSGEAATLSS